MPPTNRRKGPAPLEPRSEAIIIRVPADLRAKAEEYGRKHEFGSFAAVVRFALRKLVGEDPVGW